MTRPIDDDDLLAALGQALAPEPVEPGPEAMAALHQALDGRVVDAHEGGSGVVVLFAPPKRRSATLATIHRLRHPVVAAIAVGVLATSGVAAAGVATDHLPGPTRNVAYALGLPVTSPALETAKGTIAQLRAALAAHDVGQVLALSALLRTRLAGLSPADRASLQATADEQFAQADGFNQSASSDVSNGSGSSTGRGSSTGSGTASNSGTADSTSKGGTSSPNGESGSGSGSGDSSGGSTPVSAGSSGGGSSATTPGTSSPGTTEPGDGSGGGSTPSITPTPTITTTPGTTPTTEPGERGAGLAANSTTVTTRPVSPS